MLFAAIYTPRDSTSEESQKRSLQLFTNWNPPFEFKAHYARGDGKGGISIIESDNPEAIIEGVAPWLPFFEFDVTPVVPIEQSIPPTQRAYAWRDSVQ
jgi:Domain of unknown function (DUF3303)